MGRGWLPAVGFFCDGVAVGHGDLPVHGHRAIDEPVGDAPEGMRAALEIHDEVLHSAIDAQGGQVFSTGGDGLAAVFARSVDAFAAASQAQSALSTHAWPPDAPVRVRMAVHTGEAIERDGDYFGPALNRASRLMSMGSGGQVLVSHATEQLVQGALPRGSISWISASTGCATSHAPSASSNCARRVVPRSSRRCVHSM
jgi:class 3 adenylate cyclase